MRPSYTSKLHFPCQTETRDKIPQKEAAPVASVAAMVRWVVQHAHRARQRMERETPLPLA